MAAFVAGSVPVVVTGEQAAMESAPHRRRRQANYEPTTWDYDSICSLISQQGHGHHRNANNHQLRLMVEIVRRLLMLEEDDDSRASASTSASSRLRIIHQLQSLGIAYHFEEEIRAILLSIHHAAADLDPQSAALLFRMLRQQGIPASTDMLLLAGSAAAALREDGSHELLLALYEASYLAFPGETELEEARALAVQSLATAGDLQQQLPLHWRAPRLQAMWSLQQKDETAIDPAILQLARLDFDRVQALHRRELAEVTRWWKESGLQGRQDLPSFARDRVVECFFCAACIAPEPHLADCRQVLAKAGALIVHLDDIFDVHGTPDELQAFTDAIATWNAAAVGALPEYMKAMYAAIWETSTTAADRVLRKQGRHVLPLYKKAWHDLCKAFLVEARWHQQSHRPSFRDYLANAWVTSTGPLLLLHAAGAPIDNGRQVELSSTIFRLCNDCASHEAESERGDVPSAIACCTAEPWCGGENQARAAVRGIIADTWKELNKEMSSSTDDHNNMLCLNLARVIHCIYQDGDGITSPTHHMKRMVQDLLFNPITFPHM